MRQEAILECIKQSSSMFAGLLIYIVVLAVFASAQLCLMACGCATARWQANQLLFVFMTVVYCAAMLLLAF